MLGVERRVFGAEGSMFMFEVKDCMLGVWSYVNGGGSYVRSRESCVIGGAPYVRGGESYVRGEL